MKPAGVWVMILGIASTVVGGLLGLMGLGALGNYATLTAVGNPFAGLKGDLGIAFLGAAAIGVLVGVALMIVATQLKAAPKLPREIGAVNGPYVWDGSQWIFTPKDAPVVGV